MALAAATAFAGERTDRDSSMHILLVEDDSETSGYVARGLREEGHLVDLAKNGLDGLHQASEIAYDLLVVDRMIPGLDGIALVRSLRAAGVNAPVLFLTALGTVADRVQGLEAGGDDYLVKPFSFAELRARINALARRPPLREEETILQVADLKLDRLSRLATRHGETLDLQPREFQLLEYLMLHAGRVVTRTMLLEQIWGFHFNPGSNIVDTHISRIRAKIDHGEGPSLIQTMRGAGYMMRAH
jgi:two-component system OmpR family response regulator